jgi:hypothetical protein
MPVFTGMTDGAPQHAAQKFAQLPIEVSTAPFYSVLAQ